MKPSEVMQQHEWYRPSIWHNREGRNFYGCIPENPTKISILGAIAIAYLSDDNINPTEFSSFCLKIGDSLRNIGWRGASVKLIQKWNKEVCNSKQEAVDFLRGFE